MSGGNGAGWSDAPPAPPSQPWLNVQVIGPKTHLPLFHKVHAALVDVGSTPVLIISDEEPDTYSTFVLGPGWRYNQWPHEE